MDIEIYEVEADDEIVLEAENDEGQGVKITMNRAEAATIVESLEAILYPDDED